ncbi:HET-domain-containing protein [Jackrogersella minutella]|nr:HET-domain-containing protein [Jackrogersella minutella]
MRFINTKTLSLVDDSQYVEYPYAILSHVWGPEEVPFEEVQERQADIQSKAGWVKMEKFCAKAQEYGFDYAWIDTCCIDKRYSAELSEAINSMYRWYYNAAACFIYLEDVKTYTCDSGDSSRVVPMTRDQVIDAVRTTRWLTRGWTLQEFITPRRRHFFAADWSEIEDGSDLLEALSESTGISRKLLDDRDLLPNFCIAERMKWAAKRKTTRAEDIVYSLMGIFNVNLPVLYGEGIRNAFKRLQLEIMQTSFDMTIFAWRGDYESCGLLAQSPVDFIDTPPLRIWAPRNISSFSMTNIGLTISLNTTDEQSYFGQKHQNVASQRPEKLSDDGTLLAAFQCVVQTSTGQWQTPMVYLEHVIGAVAYYNGRSCRAYRRIRCKEWLTLSSEELSGCHEEPLIVLQNEQYELIQQSLKRQNLQREASRKALENL